MNKQLFKFLAIASLSVSLSSATRGNSVIDFDDNALASPAYHYTSAFVSNNATFSNAYNQTYDSWSGFAYSKINNPTTPGYGNQYAAAAGAAASGANYGVAYFSNYDSPAYINLPLNETAASVKLTNTTYAAKSLNVTDNFTRKFGGPTGNDPDAFTVTLTGYAGPALSGGATGTVTFYLADYRFADNSDDYIVTDWTTVSLSGLNNARSIGFTMSSTDVSTYDGVEYINTPTYFAMDDLTTVPEPASLATLAFVTAGLLLRGGRRR